MKSLQFDFSIPRYVWTKITGRWIPSMHWHPQLSCLRMREVPLPEITHEEWARIKVHYGGICGSDINLLTLHDSPATSPYASFPFTIGHEVSGVIDQAGKEVTAFQEGDRVVVDPILSCEPRGIKEPCPACQQGDFSLCHNKISGLLSPGLLIGACKDTGGGWSSHLLAHKSQLIKLPDEVSDLNAVMVEPFSCALHAIMRNPPKDDDTVLVIGAGVIGLCVVAAIRALGMRSRILVLAKHGYQAELATHFGADQVIRLSRKHDYIFETATSLKAQVLKPLLGPPVIEGGADMVIECVGRQKSVHDALTLTRNGGKVILLGLAGIMKHIDWTTVWLNELEIKGSFAYSTEEYKGRKMRTLEIAVELMREGRVDLTPLITHQFPLRQYKEALATAMNKGKGKTIKVVFKP